MFPLFPVLAQQLTLAYLRPASPDSALGAWTDQFIPGGTTNLYATIDETTHNDATDYIKNSETDGSQTEYSCPFSNPAGTPVGTVTFRCWVYAPTVASNGDGYVRVMEGATQRATITFDGTDSTWVELTTTVTGVSNWDNVSFACARDSTSVAGEWRVTQVEIGYYY